MAINLLMLTSPIYMMQIFDRALTTKNIDTLIFLSMIAIGAILAKRRAFVLPVLSEFFTKVCIHFLYDPG